MKFKHGLVTAGCLAAMGLAGTAQAVQIAGELLEVYGNFYPQYQITSFGDASTGELSTMTAGKNIPGVGTGVGLATTVSKTQVNWVNSYLGFKGQKAFGDIKAGYDFQGVVMKNGSLPTETDSIGEARDAFCAGSTPWKHGGWNCVKMKCMVGGGSVLSIMASFVVRDNFFSIDGKLFVTLTIRSKTTTLV